MRATRRISAGAALALAAVVMCGCSAPAEPVAAEAGPLFASDEEAFAAAEATYRAYEDALNEVDLADPASFQAVFDLTTGEFNALERKGLSGLHADGVTKTGDSHVALVQFAGSGSWYESVELAVCRDVSDVGLTDSSGRSRVLPDRVDLQPLTIVLDGSSLSPTRLLVSRVYTRVGGPSCVE